MASKYSVKNGLKPETYVVVALDFHEGLMTLQSIEMSEDEMREHWAKQGATREEIDELIDRAKSRTAA
jgi:SOS response regulatory protein OraA/RecX